MKPSLGLIETQYPEALAKPQIMTTQTQSMLSFRLLKELNADFIALGQSFFFHMQVSSGLVLTLLGKMCDSGDSVNNRKSQQKRKKP